MSAAMSVWKAPSGRLHLFQRCSGNGRSRETRRVSVSAADLRTALNAGKVCRCLRTSACHWLRP